MYLNHLYLKKQGGRNQLYITYQDMIIAYNMTVLEDNSSKKKIIF